MTSVKGLGASLGVAIGSSFVYENEKFFEKDEQVAFQTSGIFANISVLSAGDRNITKSFIIFLK